MAKIKANIILIILSSFALIAPDFLAKLLSNLDQAAIHGKFIVGLFAFSIFLSMAPRLFVFIILGFFIFLELVQFGHLFYYHSFISSSKFALFFNEIHEVYEAGKETILFFYYVPLVVLIPYGILLYSFNKLENTRFKSSFAMIALVACLSIIPYRVYYAYNGINYYPDPADHSLRNSLYAFTNYIMNEFNPSPKANVKYLDYQISALEGWENKKVNIILIIGESINPLHMSLFGYKLDTNPMLSSLKKDPNFSYMKAISSGVSTMVSVQLLLNGIYEPNNYAAIEKIPANLFKLSKQHNFKNFFISSQSGAALTNIGYEFIDYITFYQKDPLLFNKYQDEAFLKIIPKLAYGDKNFIVLHQRNIHAPYELNYSHRPEFNYFPVDKKDYREFLKNTYDNALRYNDWLIYQIIDFYRNKFDTPTYVFFTPDHGEGVGDNNIYGHSFLNEQTYNVAFLSYVANAKNNFQIQEPICHYEIHNLIANLIGYNILNPNLKEKTCYVQGTNLYGVNEFVEYKK